MSATYGVIDLFAGPGGLGEGFAGLKEDLRHPFRIGISVEKEQSAHQTLRLRAFLREYRMRHGKLPLEFIEFHAGARGEPDWSAVDGAAWEDACREAQCLELGTPEAAEAIGCAIDRIRNAYDDTVLIGGPPCQAYSLVGRARSKGNKDYRPEDDERHFLFREYIRVLDQLRPAAFVMENVKGMLSSTVQSRRVFEMLMDDLSSLGGRGQALYTLRAVHIEEGSIRLREALRPADFIVRAEEFGVPQRRHRVIIVGIRSDMADCADHAMITLPSRTRVTLDDVVGGLPSLRSGLSPQRNDSTVRWTQTVLDAAALVRSLPAVCEVPGFEAVLSGVAANLEAASGSVRQCRQLPAGYATSNHPLRRWLENNELLGIAQHDTRGHMEADLVRYLFVACHGRIMGRSPKASDFPAELAPAHRNWIRASSQTVFGFNSPTSRRRPSPAISRRTDITSFIPIRCSAAV